MATADAWPRNGARPGRVPGAAEARAARPARTGRPQGGPRPPSARRSPEPPARRRAEAPRPRVDDYDEYGDPRPAPRSSAGARGRETGTSAGRGGRMRGVVAVIGMFLITLTGAAADSFIGIGLGLVTLGSLVGATVLAALVVRRRDLVSVVVAPPLVFVGVALLNIGLAPSANFNLATVATLLVRGFPTMAIATGVALVLALVRAAARR